MKTDNTKTNIEKEEDKRNESETNDIKSRLRKNPNKTKPLYIDEYNDKKNKRKESQGVPPNGKEICRTILDILKKDEKSVLFRQPAIKAFSDKENKDYYKEKIKEPRDLGNITKKLKSIKYKAKEFHDDLELCWSNAMSFNEENTEAYKNAVYMKDLCDKLYKEYGLFDIINKEKEFNEKENDNEINIDNNNNDLDNNEKNDNNNINVNNINDNNNVENNENNVNVNNNENSNEIKNKKMVGRKRKRQNNINDNYENDNTEIQKDKKDINNDIDNNNFNNKFTIFDIKKKFLIKHQIFSSPDDINTVYKKTNKKKKKNKKTNIANVFKNNKSNRQTHLHHKNNLHSSRIKNVKNAINDIQKINYNDISRKINFEWIETMHFNKSTFYYTNQKDIKNEKEKNGGEQNAIRPINNLNNVPPQKYNITEFKMNINKDNKKENVEMANFDKNYNCENVYNLDEIKERKEKYSLRQSMELNNINNNQYNGYNSKDDNYMNKRNMNKKNDKYYNLRNDVAKYFDKLTDNNMIELLVFIENIRPQSIRELANDTIYINMELFNDDTFSKVLDFVKSYS